MKVERVFSDKVRMSFLQHFKFGVSFDPDEKKWACFPYDHETIDHLYNSVGEAVDAAIIEGEGL